jgi:hypothetical protein
MSRISSGKPRKLKWVDNGRGGSLLAAGDADFSRRLRSRRRANLCSRVMIVKMNILHDELLSDTFNDKASASYLYTGEWLKFGRGQCADNFSSEHIISVANLQPVPLECS